MPTKTEYELLRLKLEISNLIIEYNVAAHALQLPLLCLKKPRKKSAMTEKLNAVEQAVKAAFDKPTLEPSQPKKMQCLWQGAHGRCVLDQGHFPATPHKEDVGQHD